MQGWLREVIRVRVEKGTGNRVVSMMWWETIKEHRYEHSPSDPDVLITGLEIVEQGHIRQVKRKLSLSSQEWKEAREQYTNPHYGIGELMSRKVLECMGYTTCMEDAPQDKWDDWVYFWGLFADMVRGKVAPYFEVTTDPKGKKKGRK